MSRLPAFRCSVLLYLEERAKEGKGCVLINMRAKKLCQLGHQPPVVVELSKPGHPSLGSKVVDVEVHIGVLGDELMELHHGHPTRVVVA